MGNEHNFNILSKVLKIVQHNWMATIKNTFVLLFKKESQDISSVPYNKRTFKDV